MRERPNSKLFRDAMFSFLDIQTHRQLSEEEVLCMNYITKTRARRYVAARDKAWLYPEAGLKDRHWHRFVDDLLLMPAPRSMKFVNQIIVGYEGGGSLVADEYG